MRSRKNMVVLALVLVTENAIALAFGSSLVVSNIACVAAFVFFIMSLSPRTLLGFAVTAREWGDVFRREMQGSYDPDGPEFTRAAARSLVILSALVLLGFCMELARGKSSFATTASVLTGMEAGLVAGYLVTTRNRSSSREMTSRTSSKPRVPRRWFERTGGRHQRRQSGRCAG